MTPPTILSGELAELALANAADEPEAVRGLLTGAAIILSNRFGSEAAAHIILEMAIEARLALATAGMFAEPSRH